jgi:outer membrane biosynthesis protein TonB
MADDGSAPPLPRRAPGDSGWAGPGPTRSASLPKPVVRRILASLDVAGKQTPQQEAGPAEPSAANPPAPAEPPDPAEPSAADPPAPAEPPDPAEPPAPDPGISAEPPDPAQEAAAEPAAPEPAATPQAPPRPASPPQRLQRRTRRRRTVTSAVIVVVALAGLLALMLNRHATAATGSGGQASAGEAAIRDQAATWVASQVSRAATVACDPQMCQALEARGIPAAALLELRRGAADPLSASVIIATPAVRGLLGRSYFGRCAPAAIAGFGSGNAGISVRVIAPRGARSGC